MIRPQVPKDRDYDDPFLRSLAMAGGGFGGSGELSRSKPQFTPSSYENTHMKRARAGSISGRLRSASDLEEKGLIDKSQKGVLKDLIISGDAALQSALDRYETGDASQLVALMRRGLLDRRDSLDLLGDLDLGFLSVDLNDDDDGISSGAMREVHIFGDEDADAAAHFMFDHGGSARQDGDGVGRRRPRVDSAVANMLVGSLGTASNSSLTGALFLGGRGAEENGALEGLDNMSFNVTFEDHHDFDGRAVLSSPAGARHMPHDGGGMAHEVDALRRRRDAHSDASASSIPTSSSDLDAVPRMATRSRARVARTIGPLPIGSLAASPSHPLHAADIDDSDVGGVRRHGSGALLTDGELGDGAGGEEAAFSPQFHFSFTDDSLLELGAHGLKDDMRVLAGLVGDGPLLHTAKGADPTPLLGNEADALRLAVGSLDNGLVAGAAAAAAAAPGAAAAVAEEAEKRLVGAYSPESRRRRVERFLEKRKHRVWTKTVKYDVRKNFADTRMRVKGRFVKKDDEALLREVMALC